MLDCSDKPSHIYCCTVLLWKQKKGKWPAWVVVCTCRVFLDEWSSFKWPIFFLIHSFFFLAYSGSLSTKLIAQCTFKLFEHFLKYRELKKWVLSGYLLFCNNYKYATVLNNPYRDLLPNKTFYTHFCRQENRSKLHLNPIITRSFFICYSAAPRPTVDGATSLTWCSPLCLYLIWPEGHREPHGKVGSKSLAKHLVGFESGTCGQKFKKRLKKKKRKSWRKTSNFMESKFKQIIKS